MPTNAPSRSTVMRSQRRKTSGQAMRDVEERRAAAFSSRARRTGDRLPRRSAPSSARRARGSRQSKASARATCSSCRCAADSDSASASGSIAQRQAIEHRSRARAHRRLRRGVRRGTISRPAEDVGRDGEVGEAQHLLVDHADAVLDRFARARRREAARRCQRISPASAVTMPARILSSVDLPAPFSPTSACASPSATSKLTPRSALTAPKDLSMRSNCRLTRDRMVAYEVTP